MNDLEQRNLDVAELRVVLEALFLKKQALWDRGQLVDMNEVREASRAANELYLKLTTAIDFYVADGNVEKFKSSCQSAIENATILNEHRGMFGEFMSAVIAVVNKMGQLPDYDALDEAEGYAGPK